MSHRLTCAARRLLLAAGATLAAACGDPAGPASGSTTFDAHISGAITERVSGNASARGSDWSRQAAFTLAAPNGQLLSGVVLSSGRIDDPGMHTISFGRVGSTIESGTYRIAGMRAAGVPFPANAFSSGYTRRDGSRLQAFVADSGTLTLSVDGSRVRGTFTVHYSDYLVFAVPPRPTTPTSGITRLDPAERGRAPITITGTFDAPRR